MESVSTHLSDSGRSGDQVKLDVDKQHMRWLIWHIAQLLGLDKSVFCLVQLEKNSEECLSA